MRRGGDSSPLFHAGLSALAAGYVLLVLAVLLADVLYLARTEMFSVPRFALVLAALLLAAWGLSRAAGRAVWWRKAAPFCLLLATAAALRLGGVDWGPLRFSIILTFVSCTVTALLSVLVAVPTGYLLARRDFPGKALVDAVLDIPIVLPPLVIGVSLLILFNQVPTPDRSIEKGLAWMFGWLRRIDPGVDPGVTYRIPAVILAQFTVAAAFAVRMMVNTFDQVSPRHEQVALTLGCSPRQAFFRVVVPESLRGVAAAGTLAWARALGEFGPILIFAGATPLRTEVMSTTVFLEFTTGNLEGAVLVSMLMVLAALAVLLALRAIGARQGTL